MRRSLKGKMILSYLGVALLTVLVVSVLIWLTSGRSLMSLVVEEHSASLNTAIQEYYTANSSLQGFFDTYAQNEHKAPRPPQPGGPEQRSIRGVAGLVDSEYRALSPTLDYGVGEIVPQDRIQQKIAVTVNGQTIAWILPDNSFQFKFSAEEELFLQRTWIGGYGGGIGIGLNGIFSGRAAAQTHPAAYPGVRGAGPRRPGPTGSGYFTR
jgi:hypothetical protein